MVERLVVAILWTTTAVAVLTLWSLGRWRSAAQAGERAKLEAERVHRWSELVRRAKRRQRLRRIFEGRYEEGGQRLRRIFERLERNYLNERARARRAI